MGPKLSVITPSFNQGKYIERTILSVLDQGYANLEYVIVDGGSTDDTVEIIRRYEEHLAWWVSEPDDGQTHAINKGIERTTGEIVAYVNSDDYYLPGAFEAIARAFERTEAGWVAGAAVDVEEGDPPRTVRVWRPQPPSYCEGRIKGRHWWMLVPWCVPQPSAFWRRRLFERFGLFRPDMHYAFDAEFMLRLAYGGELPELLPDEFLSTRSVHPDQKTYAMTHSWPEIDRFVEIFRPQLTLRERARLRAIPAAEVAARHRQRIRPMAKLRFRLLHPLLRWGGDLLEYVPELVRPPIRTRDRRGTRWQRRAGLAANNHAPPTIGIEDLDPPIPITRPQPGIRSS